MKKTGYSIGGYTGQIDCGISKHDIEHPLVGLQMHWLIELVGLLDREVLCACLEGTEL